MNLTTWNNKESLDAMSENSSVNLSNLDSVHLAQVPPQDLRQRIVDVLETHKDRVLISDENISWTGAELQAKIATLREIIELTTKPGTRVGVSFPNSAVAGLSIIATICSERVPVIMCHSDLSSEDIAKSSKLSFLMTMSAVSRESLDPALPYMMLTPQGEVERMDLKPGRVSWFDELSAKPTEGTGLMLFTSGSTGKPKGVFIPGAGIVKTADYLSDYFNLSTKSVASVILPIWHSMGLNTQFLPTFFSGGRSHFMNAHIGMNRAYRTILSQNGSFVAMIGEVLRTCWEEKNRRNLPAATHVKHVQLAGGLITSQHLALAKDLFPNAVIHKGYGLTEAIRVTMINSLDPNFDSAAVGRPLPFCKVEIRDSEGRSVSTGEMGEVHVTGPNVLLGFSGQSRTPVGKDGFLGTGDLGYFNQEGQLCIAGRSDSLFKINGHKVSGLEIESLALEASEWIRGAKCLAIEDQRRAGQKIVLFLEVPLNDKVEFLSNQLNLIRSTMWVKFRNLRHFPKEIFVIESFPKTSNGKLSMKSLVEMCTLGTKTLLIENSQTSLQFYSLVQEQNSNEQPSHAL